MIFTAWMKTYSVKYFSNNAKAWQNFLSNEVFMLYCIYIGNYRPSLFLPTSPLTNTYAKIYILVLVLKELKWKYTLFNINLKT